MAAGNIVVVRENADGRKGNYYQGTDDYTLHDAHAVARVAANDTVGTYGVWIYLNDIAGTYTILSAGDNDNANEYLSLDSVAGKLRVFLKQGGATQFDVVETTAGLTARKWTHVAVVQNGTRPNLYVNGVLSTMTDTTSTDLTMWYDELANCDKFAIGVLESNATHTQDYKGAIGQIKYWPLALTADELLYEAGVKASDPASTARRTTLNSNLVFNVTYTDDGTTDSGTGLDNGTLTGNAYYGGHISDWSYQLHAYASVTGHAAEFINTFVDGDKYVSILKKGD